MGQTDSLVLGSGANISVTERLSYLQRSEGMSTMAETGPATSRRTRAGDSYVSQWNRFVIWSEASGRRSLLRILSPSRASQLPQTAIGTLCGD